MQSIAILARHIRSGSRKARCTLTLAAVSASCLLVAPAIAAPPQRVFNAKAFVGLASPDIPTDGDAALDYELDGSSGNPLHFTRCRQALATPEQDVRTDQFPLWRLLTLNCTAAVKYASSTIAQRSHFPIAMTRSLVAAFPADSAPDIGGDDRDNGRGRTLARHEKPLRITIDAAGMATARTSDADLAYTLLARADFDGDGVEDWLVRSAWAPRRAQGSGADLVLLSRQTVGGPIRIIWRP